MASILDDVITMTIPLAPVTKKNSQQIFKTRDGRPFITPSKKYKAFERDFGVFIPATYKALALECPVRLTCLYYMPTRRKVDLCNLLAATCDILVGYGVLADDSCDIVVSHDGSRVRYDKLRPRTEIEIAPLDPEGVQTDMNGIIEEAW
jgi:Holliday junction resolvase RusA-like endonuclease